MTTTTGTPRVPQDQRPSGTAPDLADPTQWPDCDTAGRLDRLRAALSAAGCDGLLVTELANIRYLTGFTGSAGLLLVTAQDALFVSDGRYAEQAGEQLGASGVAARIEITSVDQRQVVSGTAAGLATLGLEAQSVTWHAQQAYAEQWFPDSELVATRELVETLRRTKDDGEVARMRAAAAIADAALAEVRPRLTERPSERDFAMELDWTMRRRGAEDVSFETICASGPNGAKPHARPGERLITEGDLVVLDFGALVDGYHSDMTRAFAIGEVGATEQRMLDVVAEAQQAGVEAVAAGVECQGVDAVCRQVIDDAGWGEAFVHSTGHGVGLDIHEQPRMAATSTDTLEAGWVVTVEPGVYLPEHGGVRIEDTVLVTTDGCVPLTRSPKATDATGG